MMRKEIVTDIEIEAPPERVWQLLTDFHNFPAWNPFIRSISGEVKVGARLTVHIQASGTRGFRFRPTVLKADAHRELRWMGHVFVPGIFDGEHIFHLEWIGTQRTLFVQREQFKGILVPLLAARLDKDTRRGFQEMNRALKKLAEGVLAWNS